MPEIVVALCVGLVLGCSVTSLIHHRQKKEAKMTKEEKIIEWLTDEFGEGNQKIQYVNQVLRRNIPMHALKDEHDKVYRCPSCNAMLTEYYKGRPHHCKCGQKIVWNQDER